MIHLNQPLHQMLKTSSKVLLILLLTFGVFGCKNTYKVKDYLQDLANITGFSNENYLEDLSSYGIIDDEDKKELNKSLKGYFLLNTCQRYFDNHENYKDFLNENKVVDLNKEASISRNEAIEIIELLAKHINNKTFKNENKVEENNVNHLSDYELKDEILITQTKLKKDELIFLIEDEKYYKIEEVLDEGYRLSTNGDFFSQIEISAFEKDIDLADFIPCKNTDTGQIILYNAERDITIDRMIYSQIVDAVRKIHGLKRNNETPANETTKMILIDDAREEANAASQKPYKSTLKPLVSALTVKCGLCGTDKVWDMKINAFFDSIKRINKIQD